MLQRSRKIKNISYRKLIKKIILFLFLAAYALWSADQYFTSPLPNEGDPPLFYANQCDDDFSPLFRNAIDRANSSILLIVYNLSDTQIIERLEKKSLAGVSVKVVLDKSSHPHLKGIKKVHRQLAGLMHRKILVTDEKNVLIGSANFTPESLHIDDNFVAAFTSEELSTAILEMRSSHLWVGGQKVDFYPLPEEKEEALLHLVHLLESARERIQVAMFTFTHPLLVQQLIAAHQRGVQVEVIVDKKSSEGSSREAVRSLILAGVPVGLSSGNGLFHHKLAFIDGKRLIFGSANWTKAAFSKNEECLVVIEMLNQEQIEKLKKLWHAIECTSERVERCLLQTNRLSISEKNPKISILETILITT